MPFSAIFGLASPLHSLRGALEHDQLAASYLLTGPVGVGKTALALAFAEAAACLAPHRQPFESCGQCASCRRATAGTQPEIVRIAPSGDQTQIWQFWDRDGKPPGALQHTLPYAPAVGRRRVYIVERADTLNDAAANSLLKVLEEPPPYAVFVLLTPSPARMLGTVLSRSQILRLAPSPVAELEEWLVVSAGVAPDRARLFAHYAEGRAGTALSMARSTLVLEEIDVILAIAEQFPTASTIRALRLSEAIRKAAGSLKGLVGSESTTPQGEPTPAGPSDDGEPPAATGRERGSRRGVGVVIDLLVTYYRDLLRAALDGPDALLVNEPRRTAILDAAPASPPERWQSCLDALLVARRRTDQNVNLTILTDWLSLTLAASGERIPTISTSLTA